MKAVVNVFSCAGFLLLLSLVHGDALVLPRVVGRPAAKKWVTTNTRLISLGGGSAASSSSDVEVTSTRAATRAGRVVAASAALGSLLQG